MRYANTEKTVIQVDVPRAMPDGSIQTDTLNIPVDARSAHYRALVLPFLGEGGKIADFVADPNEAAAAEKAERSAAMLEALADSANAGKTLDQIRTEVTAQMALQPREVLAS